MEERIRVAVVGCGIGKFHAGAYHALSDRFELKAICDLDAAKAQELAATYQVPRVTTSLAELCDADDLDVIDICTPHNLHFEQIQQVLAARKHAICEKPLVASIKEVDELEAAAARAGRHVMPIFQYRFGHGLQKLKLLVDQGLAGRAHIATIEVAWRRRADYYAPAWRGTWQAAYGGSLLTHAIHAIDMLCYILGPVKRVYAQTATRVNPIEVEDCAAVVLEMADGALATLAATAGSPEQITRHRFCFSGLSAESNTRPYNNSHDPWTFTGDSPELAERIEAALAGFVGQPQGFAGQFYHYSESMRHEAEPPVTLADARAALELLTAMYTAARTGQTVDLPLGKDHPGYAGWLPESAAP